jgi:hypothetical protein
VNNNYLDLGMDKSGFVHTLLVAGLSRIQHDGFDFSSKEK